MSSLQWHLKSDVQLLTISIVSYIIHVVKKNNLAGREKKDAFSKDLFQLKTELKLAQNWIVHKTKWSFLWHKGSAHSLKKKKNEVKELEKKKNYQEKNDKRYILKFDFYFFKSSSKPFLYLELYLKAVTRFRVILEICWPTHTR